MRLGTCSRFADLGRPVFVGRPGAAAGVAGTALARAAPVPKHARLLVPHWDRQTGELFLGDRVVAQFRGIATNVITVLDAFEDADWARRVCYLRTDSSSFSPEGRSSATFLPC